ncbi:MAG: helix-turn-helix transcriptional regulator, partial [Acidobacteriota bacterium]|nr:helix-turn-helix transcriptional regulator [Acidobacteriota bacterium]
MVRGYRTFKDFQFSGEGIASNVLAGRLRKLQAEGLITAAPEASDARRLNYRLTEKGIGLAPVLLELYLWAARYEDTGAPCAVLRTMRRHPRELIAEVRRRWRNGDTTPLIP